MNELQQDLLEMHYGLLDDDAAQALQRRIHTEPEVAAMWADTMRMAEQFADAARLTGLPKTAPADQLDRLVDRAKRETVADSAEVAPAVPPHDTSAKAASAAAGDGPVTGRKRKLFGMRTFLLAASILVAVCGLRFWNELPDRPATAMLLEAAPIGVDQAQGSNAFRVATMQTHPDSGMVGRGMLPLTPASLTFSVYARGTLIFRQQQTTGGETSFQVPDDLLLPEGAWLRVDAAHADGSQVHLDVPLQATRCLTYLNTDRPVYRPGEIVFFRSLTLQRQSFVGEYIIPIRYQLLDPSSAVVSGTTIDGVTERGVGNGAISLPQDLAGGTYTLVATSLDGVFPEERRTIEVREYRVPRFIKEIQLDQRSYGPGDVVVVEATIRRAEGEPLADARVQATAVVDGQVVATETWTTDEQGMGSFSFSLPMLIRVGEGHVSLIIDDGGTRETLTKTIPIQTDRVEIDFYPEGGYLVEGLRNRVYFSARNTQGEPIQMEGEIMTRGGRRVAKIETRRDGMGRFEFVPEPGQRYVATLSKPLDVTTDATLPAVVADRPVLDTGSGVFAAGSPLDLVLRTTRDMKVRVQAVCRGSLAGEIEAELNTGSNTLRLPVAESTSGVVRVTVFASDTREPLAERLVFRSSNRKLKVQVKEAESIAAHSPGEPLRLTLQVTDEKDQPVAAVLGVSVVDQASLGLQTKERPSLDTHFLLTSEVERPEDLEHANFYLEDSVEAAEALDLLLGTQGWRRFIYNDAVTDTESLEEQLQRLLRLDGTQAAATTRLSNRGVIRLQWRQYRTALDRAYANLLTELRWLLLPLIIVWTLLAWLRSRWNAAAAACLLLAVSSSAWIVGCGVQHPVSSEVMQDTAESPAAGNGVPMGDEAMIVAPEAADHAEPTLPVQPAVAPDTIPGLPDPAGLSTTLAPTSPDIPIDLSEHPTLSQQDLERLLAARGIDAQELARRLFEELRFPIREYAHRHQPSAARRDFAETLYWHPLLVTDSNGIATIRFDLSDSITSFRVHADAHSAAGQIGSGEAEVVSRLPFQVEPKLPLAVTVGDVIDLPVAVVNASAQPQTPSVAIHAETGLTVEATAATQTTSLEPGERARLYFPVNVDAVAAGQQVRLNVSGRTTRPQPLSDEVSRVLSVAPQGFPIRRSTTTTVTGSHRLTLDLPEDYVDGSLQLTVRGYPSPLADLMGGVESILAEPHGCFEQASAANYPNALALQYLQKNGITNPQITQRAEGFLERGYEKLTRYECERRGYEWFGQDPGHEALSAFGLMQFNDMRDVMPVDVSMISRTRQWLLARRDGRGGWQRNPRHLHVWSVRQDVVNAYVLWAITEADAASGNVQLSAVELSTELAHMESVARDSQDPYLLALSAAALANANRTAAAKDLLVKLQETQSPDGSLTGQTSVTQSGGKSLQVETTALAVIAWSKLSGFDTERKQAAQWLVASRDGRGGFGSTQATVLALKALLAIGNSAAVQGGRLVVSADGQAIAEARLPDDPADGSMLEITGLAERLQAADLDPREVTLELSVDDGIRLPCTIDIAFHSKQPDSDPETAVQLDVQLDQTGEVTAGSVVQLDATLKNVTSTGLPMTVAVVELPGGVEPRPEELDELRRQGVFDYYELRPREVILYWRTIPPDETKRVRFHVTAEVPGQYTAPASRAYLYYTAERVHWTPPLSLQIGR